MSEHYIKLFHLGWIDAWMVEAVITIVCALILGLILAKCADCWNQIDR